MTGCAAMFVGCCSCLERSGSVCVASLERVDAFNFCVIDAGRYVNDTNCERAPSNFIRFGAQIAAQVPTSSTAHKRIKHRS